MSCMYGYTGVPEGRLLSVNIGWKPQRHGKTQTPVPVQ